MLEMQLVKEKEEIKQGGWRPQDHRILALQIN